MSGSAERDGVRRRGGALFGELRRLDLMHEAGNLSDEAYRGARGRLMRSVADAVEVGTAPRPAAPAPAATGGIGLPALAAAALAAIAMVGATPAVLACIGLAALATLVLAIAWEA